MIGLCETGHRDTEAQRVLKKLLTTALSQHSPRRLARVAAVDLDLKLAPPNFSIPGVRLVSPLCPTVKFRPRFSP